MTKESQTHWGTADVFALLAVYVALSFSFAYFKAMVFGSTLEKGPDQQPVLFVLGEVLDAAFLAFLPVFLVVRVYRSSVREIGLVWAGASSKLVTGIAAGLALAAIAAIYDAILGMFGVIGGHPYLELLERTSTFVGHSAILASVLLLAPISEKIFYRGFAFTAFEHRYGTLLAVIASATLFSIVHFSAASFALIWIIGAALAWLFHRTKSLVAPMAAHMVINFVAISIADIKLTS